MKQVVGLLLLVAVQGSVSIPDQCSEKCKDTFQPHTTDIPQGIESCEKGCRLYLLIDGAVKSEDPSAEDTLKNCKHSCDDAYSKDSSSQAACQSGCDFQNPLANSNGEPKNVKTSENTDDDDSEEIQEIHLPFFTLQLSNMMEAMDKFELPTWAENMQKSMDETHKRMMSWMMNDLPDKGFSRPDLLRDAVSKMNPLEQFFNSGDVEMIDPKDSTSNDLNDQKSDNRVFEIEIIGPYSLDSSSIKFKKDFLDEQTLGEESYQSRADAEYTYLDRVCQKESKDLSWSDVFSCVHHHMHVPWWFTIATVLLSIVFMIWLCFVIPATAPKQKVTSAEAKEKEALSIVSVHLAHATSIPNDFPPSYDEVANLKVQMSPVHQTIIDETPKATKI